MPSALYEGIVRHRRFAPVAHRFTQSLFLALIDVDELPDLYDRGLLAPSGWGPAVLQRSDFLGGGNEPLAQTVRTVLARDYGHTTRGPIELLCPLRQFGFFFSPLNLYFCWDARRERVEAVLAEVSNTPWNERHYYLLDDHNRAAPESPDACRSTLAAADPGCHTPALHHRHAKAFHVSPFLEMDYDYHWRLTPPGEHLRVAIANRRGREKRFDAALALRRQPFTRANLARLMVRYPWMALQVTLGIYFQALQLWIKQCPYVPHPHSPAPAIPTASM